MNISLAIPTVQFAESLSVVAAKSFYESHRTSADIVDLKLYAEGAYTIAQFEKEFANTQNIFRAAFVNQTLAGYSKIIPNCTHEGIPEENVCKMERLYVLEEFIPLKVGQLLFDECISLAKAAQQFGIWLNVWTGNLRAIRFYQKMGFVKVGDTIFKLSERHSNPNYLMWKAL